MEVLVKSIDEEFKDLKKSSHDALYISKFQHAGKKGRKPGAKDKQPRKKKLSASQWKKYYGEREKIATSHKNKEKKEDKPYTTRYHAPYRYRKG